MICCYCGEVKCWFLVLGKFFELDVVVIRWIVSYCIFEMLGFGLFIVGIMCSYVCFFVLCVECELVL